MVNDDDDDDMYVFGYRIIALTVASGDKNAKLKGSQSSQLGWFNMVQPRGWERAEGGGILRELLRAFVKKGPLHSPFVSERLARVFAINSKTYCYPQRIFVQVPYLQISNKLN